jgi:hypothetical protein
MFATKKVSVTVGELAKKTEKGSMRCKGRMKVKIDVKG